MEVFNIYILSVFGLLLAVLNVYTTREAFLYPLFSSRTRAFVIALIWLVPFIGLIIAYKKLHLNPSLDTAGDGDGTQVHTGGGINDESSTD